MSSSESSRVLRLIRKPKSLASINKISFLRFLNLPLVRFRLINHKEAGIWVFRNNLVGRFTIQSIKSASIKLFLISPSPEDLEVGYADTLKTYNGESTNQELAICIARYMGAVRLIDNVVFKTN